MPLESHDEPPSGQGKYGQIPYGQGLMANNLVDEYGDEIYNPAMITHMSQMANPASNYFPSEAKRSAPRANSNKYGGKRGKHRKNHKSKKNKHRKKYSSDEEAPEYDRHRYRAGGFDDDDIN